MIQIKEISRDERIIYVSESGIAAETLDSIKAAVKFGLKPGDSLLLEGGSIFKGPLNLNGIKGPITIGSYGIGPAIISADTGSGIILEECQKIKISGLTIQGCGWKENQHGVGIDIKKCEEIKITHIEASGFRDAGIQHLETKDLDIKGCFIHDNGASGITGAIGKRPNLNLKISHCIIYNNAGDPDIKSNHSGSGIVIVHTHNALVEYCEAAGNGWGQRQLSINGPVGIWCACGCEGVTVRWCISHDNRTQPGCVDGDGFDIDGAVVDGLLEYNYSYGNEGSGYLLCEYGSGMDWRNNTVRHCVSISDAHRVKQHGSLTIYGPDWLKLENALVEKCLLAAAAERHCVVNLEVGTGSSGIAVKDNVFVSSEIPAVQTPENPNMLIENNVEISNDNLSKNLTEAAPRLTDPMKLKKLPIFSVLEKGNCGELLKTKGPEALFGSFTRKPKKEPTALMTTLLDGTDFEGCDYKGNISLVYDSIKPGMATKLGGRSSEISTVLPWVEEGMKYVVRVRGKLEGPDAAICVFVRNEAGEEKHNYLCGSVSEYNWTCVEFIGSSGYTKVGIRQESGINNAFVDKLEFLEAKEFEGEELIVKNDLACNLSNWICRGDVREVSEEVDLYNRVSGPGSGFHKFIFVKVNSLRFSAWCKSTEGSSIMYVKQGDKVWTEVIIGEQWKYYELECSPEEGTAMIGFWNSCENSLGEVLIKNIELRSE